MKETRKVWKEKMWWNEMIKRANAIKPYREFFGTPLAKIPVNEGIRMIEQLVDEYRRRLVLGMQ